MSFELKYTKDGVENSRTVQPLGNFAINTVRDNHRYSEEFAGEMTFKGDDFDWIMLAGSCTEISITCEFKRQWKGLFSHTDCTIINRSKKYLEVVPRTDDEYAKFVPWMRLEMNIIPPYNGTDSRVSVNTYNQYEIETRTVRIDEPYDGDYSENWMGYSVNDFIGNNGIIPANPYHELVQINNSLIWKMFNGVSIVLQGTESAKASYRLLWLDSLGFDLLNAEKENPNPNALWYLISFRLRYWRESLFTLAEVINYYTDEGDWEYCDLVYYREKYSTPSNEPPPSGLHWPVETLTTETPESELPQSNPYVNSGRWIFNPADRAWYRRYLALHQRGTYGIALDDEESGATGNGFDFSPLIETMQNDRVVRKQVLFRNKYEQDFAISFGVHAWYDVVYGFAIFGKIFHKPTILLQKFIEFIKDKRATTSLTKNDIVSAFWTNENNPYSGNENIWKNVLVGQNSDIKRPLVTEQATKEMMSFEDFLNVICSISNCAWAIIDGKLQIEHISYFDKALNYGLFADANSILNPFSIENVAKNKGYLELTDAYSYDRPNMPKFEIYKTEGGEEPINNNLKIEYEGGCVNNLPNENTREINIATTTDYNWTRTEARDNGITLILTDNFNQYFPQVDPVFGHHVYNRDFTLEKIIEQYHNWGRNDTQALLNRKEWLNLQPFKNVIQNVSFPYKVISPVKMENPYVLIITGLGYGQIRRAEYTTKGSWMDYELGLFPLENVIPPDTTMDWHIHNQASNSDTWTISHDMNTTFMMRPVVFDTEGEEIEYNSFRILNINTLELTFAQPVNGEAHFIALNVGSAKLHTSNWLNASSITIDHNLDKMVDEIAMSCIFDLEGNEVQPDSIKYISDNTIDIEFTSAVSGSLAVADITGGYAIAYSAGITDADTVDLTKTPNRVYNKPLVLMAGEEIFYNSHKLLEALRRIGFSENVIASIVVMEKIKD